MKSNKNLITNLLNGDLSIGKTYWIFGVLGVFTFELSFFLLTFSLQKEHLVASWIIGLVLVLEIIYFAIITIAILRITRKRNSEKFTYWPNFAAAALILIMGFFILENLNILIN